MAEPSLPTNRMAIVSLASAVLTVSSFCVGFAPFLPMTAPFCYPLALVFGLVALASGVLALVQLRKRNENGRWMAWTGTLLGGMIPFAIVCALTVTASFFTAWLLQNFNQTAP